MEFDITSNKGLNEASIALTSDREVLRGHIPWFDDMARLCVRAREATLDEVASLGFQTILWRDHPLPLSGHEFSIEDVALQDEDLRSWLAETLRRSIPEGNDGDAAFERLHKECADRLKMRIGYVPWMQLLRVLTTFYPGRLGFELHQKKVRALVRALGLVPSGRPFRNAVRAMHAIHDALGSPNGFDQVLKRAAFAYQLAGQVRGADTAGAALVEDEDMVGSDLELEPLPAALRRKGLTTIKGNLDFVYPALEFVVEGVSREQLRDYVRVQMPSASDGTVGSVVHVLTNELGLLTARNGMYALSERGLTLLESREPSVLRDWLLTRVLGIDHVCAWLSAEGRIPTNELQTRIKALNPGWTTLFAPVQLLAWLRSLGVVEIEDGTYALTARGRRWAARVTWTPEALGQTNDDVNEEFELFVLQPEIILPSTDELIERCLQAAHFPPTLVAQLHAGLWSDQRRHFAILAGLSGSGKTLLARRYGLALQPTTEGAERYLCTVPVQPGWHDPSALLGYVNPLNTEAYARTPFLEFVLRAVSEPNRPFVAVLDEMNLSHPERYLAPLLSAMETGDMLHLHENGDRLDGVPGRVPYPANLVLIGTVNMDETTCGLSDKVLDRAFTFEFWDVDVARYEGWQSTALAAETKARLKALLESLGAALAPARMHFGWRVVKELIGFVERATASGATLTLTETLDAAVYAKVLPKLRGEDRPSFRSALAATQHVLQSADLPRSLAKVRTLQEELEATGSAHFWR